MTQRFNPRWIVGKTVASVDMQRSTSGVTEDDRKICNPIITFTDGSSIRFSTQEAEGGYGTDIVYRPNHLKRRKP